MKNNNYHKIANYYDAIHNLVFGPSILKSQKAFIDSLPSSGNLLIIGGGSGKILKSICSLKPQLQIVYIDASLKMIRLAKSQMPNSNQILFIHGTENNIPNIKFDALATFYFLDLFKSEKMNRIANQLYSSLKSDGLWLIADFNQPKNLFQKIVEKAMFSFLKVTTHIESDKIEDFQLFFNEKSMQKIAEKEFYGNFIFSRLYRKKANKKSLPDEQKGL